MKQSTVVLFVNIRCEVYVFGVNRDILLLQVICIHFVDWLLYIMSHNKLKGKVSSIAFSDNVVICK